MVQNSALAFGMVLITVSSLTSFISTGPLVDHQTATDSAPVVPTGSNSSPQLIGGKSIESLAYLVDGKGGGKPAFPV